jgi:ATP-dependent Clp protease ATP-binding subunit ClpC
MSGFDSLGGRAKQVLNLAVEEARAFKHGWLGAEHLLLGILRERSGAAHRVLEDRGIALELMRERILEILPEGQAAAREIGTTPRVQHVVGIARGLALGLGQDRVTPEHLLLGLLDDGESVPVHILEELGARRADMTVALRRELNVSPPGA